MSQPSVDNKSMALTTSNCHKQLDSKSLTKHNLLARLIGLYNQY